MLIYSAIASLDGYVSDRDGNFDWAAPGPEVHAFLNELERPIGTYLYGRRMYETMVGWETMSLDDAPQPMRDYAAIWRAADKIVYSTTLSEVSSSRTRLERTFDPEAVRRLKAEGDVSVGGPHLAAHALAAGLVSQLCAPEELIDTAMAHARTIARNAPLAVIAAKRALRVASGMHRSENLDFERALFHELALTEDRNEGRRAFREKRQPVFKGK